MFIFGSLHFAACSVRLHYLISNCWIYCYYVPFCRLYYICNALSTNIKEHSRGPGLGSETKKEYPLRILFLSYRARDGIGSRLTKPITPHKKEDWGLYLLFWQQGWQQAHKYKKISGSESHKPLITKQILSTKWHF